MARRIKVESTQTTQDEELDMAIAQLDEDDSRIFEEAKAPKRHEMMQAAAAGELLSLPPTPAVVEVTWGQELFSPVKYTTVTVGPFSAKGEVLQGETIDQAYERLYARVRAFAERERERKLASFVLAAKTAMQNG